MWDWLINRLRGPRGFTGPMGPIGEPGVGIRGAMGPVGPRGKHAGESDDEYRTYLAEFARRFGEPIV